jgi:hypothetical protein
VTPHQARRGEGHQQFPVELEEERRQQQRHERRPEPPAGDAAVAQLRRHRGSDEAADGRDDVDRAGDEVGGADAGYAGEDEDHRQVEGEGGELRSLHRVGYPREDTGPPAYGVLADAGEEVAGTRALHREVLVGQHRQIVVEHLLRDCLGLPELAALDEPQRGVGHVQTADEQDERGHRAQTETDAPQQAVVHAAEIHHGDDGDGGDLTEAEHALPAVAHHLPLALGHRLHDVRVAGGDVAAQREPQQEPDDHQLPHARREGLGQREDHEEHHRGDEDLPPPEPVGEPAAEHGAEERPQLYGGRGEAEHRRAGVEVLLDEEQEEGDRVQIPCLDEDRRDHQPAGAAAGVGAVLGQDVSGRDVRKVSYFCLRSHVSSSRPPPEPGFCDSGSRNWIP